MHVSHRLTDRPTTTTDDAGIFDADTHFKECKNMNVSMHRLLPACKRAKRILDMLEHGVTDALARGYVRSVAFALMRSRASGGGNGDLGDGRTRTGVRDDAETVEEYKFNVRYGSRGEVTLDDVRRETMGRPDASVGLTEGTGKTTRLERLYDIDYIKRAAISMTRCLLSLVKTLEEVPDGCTFSMRLAYVQGTPADYEPPFFEAGDANRESSWTKTPFSMSVGKVETEHHGLSLRVRSILDPAQDDSGAKSNLGSSQTSSLLDEPVLTPNDGAHVDADAHVQLSQQEPAPVDEFSEEEVTASVLEWIGKQKAKTFVDSVACSKTLRQYPFKAIDDAFKRLKKTNQIEETKRKGSFALATPKGAKKRKLSAVPPRDVFPPRRLRSANKK